MISLIPTASAAAGAPAAGGSQLAPLLVMGAFIVAFYFLLIRPQQKKAKEHQSLLSKLGTGDEVVTSGGVLGRIVEVGEHFITIEVAQGVQLKVQKAQISALMPKGTLKSA